MMQTYTVTAYNHLGDDGDTHNDIVQLAVPFEITAIVIGPASYQNRTKQNITLKINVCLPVHSHSLTAPTYVRSIVRTETSTGRHLITARNSCV